MGGRELARSAAEALRRDAVEIEGEGADVPFNVQSWLGVAASEEDADERSAARCVEDLSEEAAERVAFIFAEASDLAALGLRAESACEVDGIVSVGREVAELAETERELEAS